jgi:hypothetical protein
MALYRYIAFLQTSTEAVYDTIFNPGQAAPVSGIYRCMGCGREVASNQNQPLPPQNHHQHTTEQGAIRWRLIVYADHRPK